jgi:hypothetical protein
VPNTNRFYRLRIRAADDLSDFLVLTSVPGGTNPYLVKPITGDGRGFDPLSGEVETGSYSVDVIDALTAPNTRVITAALADANARQQLLSRKTYAETSTDGSSWASLYGGYINRAQLASAGVFSFSIGETRRIQANKEVFKSTVLTKDINGVPLTFSQFDKTTCIFGGPIRGGFLWVRDLGGWRFKVTQAVAGPPKYVQMKIVRAFDARKPEMGTFSTLSSRDRQLHVRRRSSLLPRIADLEVRDDPRLVPRDPIPRAVDDWHARRKLHAALRARTS